MTIAVTATGADQRAAHGWPGQRQWRHLPLILLGLFFGLVYLATLDVRPLIRHDEFRYAEIPREMLASGDFVTPRLNGLRYFEKPVLGYWLEAAAIQTFGESRFALRLVSAMSTGLTALFIFAFVATGTGRRDMALLASLIYLSSLLVFVIGTLNVLDPGLTLWISLACGLAWLGLESPGETVRRGWLLAAGASAGLAFLTKGPIGLVVPAIVTGSFLLWQKQPRRLLSVWLWAGLAAVVIALPWAIMIHLREPGFWPEFLWQENVRRLASSTVSRAEPAWFFLALLPAMVLPWTFLALPALTGLRREYTGQALLRYLVAWFVAPFILFSIARAKLITYVLPCLPPLAILIAIGLQQAVDHGRERMTRAAMALLGAAYLAGLAWLLANAAGLAGQPVYGPAETRSVIAVSAALIAGAAISFGGAGKRSAPIRHWLCPLSVTALLIVLPFCIPQAQRDNKMPGEFLRSQAAQTSPDALLVASGTLVRAVNFSFRRDDVYLFLDAGELRRGLSHPDAGRRLLDEAGLRRIITNNAGRREIVVICMDWDAAAARRAMPSGARTAAQGRFRVLRLPASG